MHVLVVPRRPEGLRERLSNTLFSFCGTHFLAHVHKNVGDQYLAENYSVVFMFSEVPMVPANSCFRIARKFRSQIASSISFLEKRALL